MTAIRVNDIKKFMELLLSGEAFDTFMFIEAEISEILGDAAFHTWAVAKESVRQTVKGKKLPVRMKVVLQKDGEQGTQIINVRYDASGLTVVTGFAQKGFNPDKQPERNWDREAFEFLKGFGIDIEIC